MLKLSSYIPAKVAHWIPPFLAPRQRIRKANTSGPIAEKSARPKSYAPCRNGASPGTAGPPVKLSEARAKNQLTQRESIRQALLARKESRTEFQVRLRG